MLDIDACIFDLDGVITDTAELHYLSWKQLADEEGIPFTRRDNEKLRGVTRRESLRRMLKGREIDEAVAQVWMDRKNAYFHTMLKGMSPADRLPGITQVLSDARAAGLKLAVGSASQNAKPVLERLDLLHKFDVVGDAFSVANTKPAPDVFVWVAGAMGVPVMRTLIFEDSEAGVEAGLRAGAYVVGLGTSDVGRAHIVLPGLAESRLADVLDRLTQVVQKSG